jgi:hypothetical protein
MGTNAMHGPWKLDGSGVPAERDQTEALRVRDTLVARILSQVDLASLDWRGEGVQMARVADTESDELLTILRSGREPEAGVLVHTRAEWGKLLLSAQNGDFDLPPTPEVAPETA